MEDMVCQNQRIVKRRLMEVQSGLEVRRLHIVYFLSRNGRNEDPHLIRIHHLSKHGVRLKDIKRWLGGLRGKDMPESFAWSYKRRYKAGYVWQDLVDDDLVTPFSDNEYVLKGSEISSSTSYIESAKDSQENPIHSSNSSIYVSPKPESKIVESPQSFGSETSTLTDDNSRKEEPEKNSDTANQEACSSLSIVSSTKEKKRRTSISKTAESSDKKPHIRKSHLSGILGSLITCGGVHTNDSAVVMTNKRSKSFTSTCSSHEDSTKQTSAAYKPLYGPTCSQCGKQFKPEKMHAHMKTCKGMKARAKGSNPAIYAAKNTSITSNAFTKEDTISGYLLPH